MLVTPPWATYDDLDAIDVRDQPTRTVSVRFPLWTVEEGCSDLEIVLTFREDDAGTWIPRVDDILAP